MKARTPKRYQLDTRMAVPKSVWVPARAAAEEAVLPHVLAWLRVYHGDITKLAVGCYLQGLLDAAQLSQESPGWPALAPRPTPPVGTEGAHAG